MIAKTMTVAGIMSGTSADGVDVAIVRIKPGLPSKSKRASSMRPKITLLAHEGFRYPAALRCAVLGAMNAASISTPELAKLNWRLGLAYADAVRATLAKAPEHDLVIPDKPRAQLLPPRERGTGRPSISSSLPQLSQTK